MVDTLAIERNADTARRSNSPMSGYRRRCRVIVRGTPRRCNRTLTSNRRVDYFIMKTPAAVLVHRLLLGSIAGVGTISLTSCGGGGDRTTGPDPVTQAPVATVTIAPGTLRLLLG